MDTMALEALVGLVGEVPLVVALLVWIRQLRQDVTFWRARYIEATEESLKLGDLTDSESV